jgi:hypothetical protein
MEMLTVEVPASPESARERVEFLNR